MRLVDSRRLTGPNLQQPRAGALAEVEFEQGEDPSLSVAAWRAQLKQLAAALGGGVRDWPPLVEAPTVRLYPGGAALSFTAPLDLLLVATDVNDLAVARATLSAAGQPLPELEPMLAPIRAALQSQSRPRLLALEAACKEHDLPLLSARALPPPWSGSR